MKKLRPHYTVRQRQKMSFSTIVFVSTFCVALVATGLVILINIIHVEKSMAQQTSEFTIEEESFVNDKALPSTVVKQHPMFGTKTQFMRKAKAIPSNQTNISE